MRFTAVHDITKRKWMEEALRQSEEQYRTFFELGAVGMGQADPVTGKLLQVNDRFCGGNRLQPAGVAVEDGGGTPITHRRTGKLTGRSSSAC